mgnify:CR=1 FL=1
MSACSSPAALELTPGGADVPAAGALRSSNPRPADTDDDITLSDEEIIQYEYVVNRLCTLIYTELWG